MSLEPDSIAVLPNPDRTTMSLDLGSELYQEYARVQNDRIRQHPKASYLFEDSNEEFWNDLWKSVWLDQTLDISDQDHEVKRSTPPDAIDNSLISPHTVPSSCHVMDNPPLAEECWPFDCAKILVRSEYTKAEEFAVKRCGEVDSLIVTGQPGIGTSLSYTNFNGS